MISRLSVGNDLKFKYYRNFKVWRISKLYSRSNLARKRNIRETMFSPNLIAQAGNRGASPVLRQFRIHIALEASLGCSKTFSLPNKPKSCCSLVRILLS